MSRRATILPLRTKLGYGSAELGISAVEFFIQVYLLKFYTDRVGLQPADAGLALALAVIWDAVTDPLMGGLSDGAKLAWGKRRPFILAGGLLLGAAFVFVFSPPALATQGGKFAYLLIGYILVNTAMTVIAVPHAALAGELTGDPDQRTQLFGYRFLFANLGLIFGIAAPGVAAALAGNSSGAMGAVAGGASQWIAGAVILSALVSVIATRGLDRPGPGRFSFRAFWRSLGAALTCRPFIPLILAYLVGTLGRTLNSSIALFYYEHRLKLAEADVFLYILLPFTFVIALSIVGWTLLSRKVGKKRPAFWGVFLLGLYTCVAYPLFPAGVVWLPAVGGMIGGVLVGSVFLLDSTVADVVDYDEVQSGVHREGLYFGFWRMAAKLSRAAGLALSGMALDWVGFRPEADAQSAETAWGLALMFGPGVGLFFMIAAAVFLWMPLTARKNRQVQRILRQRKNAHPREAA